MLFLSLNSIGQYKYTGNNRKPYLSSDSESVKSGVFTNKNSKASSNVNSESSDLKKVQYIPKAEALQKNKDVSPYLRLAL